MTKLVYKDLLRDKVAISKGNKEYTYLLNRLDTSNIEAKNILLDYNALFIAINKSY